MKVIVSITDVVIGKKMLPSIHESLQERGTIQTIALDRNTALEVQVRSKKFLNSNVIVSLDLCLSYLFFI